MLARVHFAPIRVLNNFKVSLEFSIELGRAEERREVGAAEGVRFQRKLHKFMQIRATFKLNQVKCKLESSPFE